MKYKGAKYPNSNWKWRYDENGQEIDEDGKYLMCYCKFCKHEAYYMTDYGGMYEEFDFCPFCGRNMMNNKDKGKKGNKKRI